MPSTVVAVSALLVVGVVFWFVRGTILEGLAELGEHPLKIKPGWLVLSAALYVATDLILAPRFGNAGVWTAFLLMYVYRAAGLGAFWPRLVRAAGAPGRPALPVREVE